MESQEDQAKRIGQLEDQLKEAERKIAELKINLEEERHLTGRMREHVENANALIESWKEGFNLELCDDGFYRHRMSEQYDDMRAKLIDIVKDWNRFVPKYNAAILQRDVGRPLGATEAQCGQVRKLRHHGKLSLRQIADETNLGLQTVRTIIGQDTRTDRTSIKRLAKIDPERNEVAAWKARKRTRDALPKRINEALKEGAALIKAAKGLGQA